MCQAKKKDARYIKKFNVAIIISRDDFIQMELFEQHRSPFQQRRSYCQEPDCIWQKGLAEVERRCGCSSKITQRRYKVSRHRTPNFHSLHFMFHPAALPRCNPRRAEPRPRPQPESNYALLNILLKSKRVCVGGVDQNKRISASLKNLLGEFESLDPEHARHPHVFPPLVT